MIGLRRGGGTNVSLNIIYYHQHSRSNQNHLHPSFNEDPHESTAKGLVAGGRPAHHYINYSKPGILPPTSLRLLSSRLNMTAPGPKTTWADLAALGWTKQAVFDKLNPERRNTMHALNDLALNEGFAAEKG